MTDLRDLEDLVDETVPRKTVLALARELRETRSERDRYRSQFEGMYRRLCNAERFHVRSRRSLCEKMDEAEAEIKRLKGLQ